MIFQQGDVLLIKIDEIENGLKKLKHLTLAEGETTGHSHRITTGTATLYQASGPRAGFVLEVSSDTATLTHEEHKPITLPKGVWQVRKVMEFDHFNEVSGEVRD